MYTEGSYAAANSVILSYNYWELIFLNEEDVESHINTWVHN